MPPPVEPTNRLNEAPAQLSGPVVVTGASGGVGRAVAEAFAAKGRAIGLLGRSQELLEATLAAVGGRGAAATADVGDELDLARAIADLEAVLGPPEVLVCAAGIGAYGPIRTTPTEVVERLVRTNFFGTVHAVRAVLDGMVERGRGHIVVIGSIAGHLGVPLEAAYSASKFAVSGWSEALAVEVAGHGVAVTLVSPGPIDTGFFAARGVPYRRRRPRPVAASRVADAVVHAVERRAAERVLPRRLRGAVVVRALSPSAYRRGAGRSLRSELREQGA